MVFGTFFAGVTGMWLNLQGLQLGVVQRPRKIRWGRLSTGIHQLIDIPDRSRLGDYAILISLESRYPRKCSCLSCAENP